MVRTHSPPIENDPKIHHVKPVVVTVSAKHLCCFFLIVLMLISAISISIAYSLQKNEYFHQSFVKNEVNYFAVLGLDPSASSQEIRKAYKALALK